MSINETITLGKKHLTTYMLRDLQQISVVLCVQDKAEFDWDVWFVREHALADWVYSGHFRALGAA